MNPFKTQQEINEYLNKELNDIKRRLAALEEDNKKRINWFEPIVTPQPQFRKWVCDQCHEPIDKSADEVWYNGHVFCTHGCRIAHSKTL